MTAVLASLGVAVACGGSAPPAQPAGSSQCGGEARQALNCEAEVQYQATNVKGGVNVLGLGSASGDVEQKALRQIDDQTAMYIAEARRLCDEYNKCVLERDTYATRSENLRRRMAKVPELVEDLKNASTDDAKRVALSKAYREIVPEEARTELRLDFSVLAQRPGESQMAAAAQGASLPTGTRVAFFLQPSRPANILVFERSGNGAVHVLFPDARIAVQNPIGAGGLRVPQGDLSFKLDDKDIGTESIYIVASLRPAPELQRAVLSGGEAEQQGAMKHVTSIDPNCRQRGFSLEETEPKEGCSRSRGLFLDAPESAGKSVSQSTVTEAADDTIATVFRFEHTRS